MGMVSGISRFNAAQAIERHHFGARLILMLIGFLLANIYSAMNHVDFGGHREGPRFLLFRVPFQFFVVWWTSYATKQNSYVVNQPHVDKP